MRLQIDVNQIQNGKTSVGHKHIVDESGGWCNAAGVLDCFRQFRYSACEIFHRQGIREGFYARVTGGPPQGGGTFFIGRTDGVNTGTGKETAALPYAAP